MDKSFFTGLLSRRKALFIIPFLPGRINYLTCRTRLVSVSSCMTSLYFYCSRLKTCKENSRRAPRRRIEPTSHHPWITKRASHPVGLKVSRFGASLVVHGFWVQFSLGALDGTFTVFSPITTMLNQPSRAKTCFITRLRTACAFIRSEQSHHCQCVAFKDLINFPLLVAPSIVSRHTH